MEKHITITAANDAESTIFIKNIVMIQRSLDDGRAYIHTSSDKALIKTNESYENVLMLIKEA